MAAFESEWAGIADAIEPACGSQLRQQVCNLFEHCFAPCQALVQVACTAAVANAQLHAHMVSDLGAQVDAERARQRSPSPEPLPPLPAQAGVPAANALEVPAVHEQACQPASAEEASQLAAAPSPADGTIAADVADANGQDKTDIDAAPAVQASNPVAWLHTERHATAGGAAVRQAGASQADIQSDADDIQPADADDVQPADAVDPILSASMHAPEADGNVPRVAANPPAQQDALVVAPGGCTAAAGRKRRRAESVQEQHRQQDENDCEHAAAQAAALKQEVPAAKHARQRGMPQRDRRAPQRHVAISV